MTVDPESRLASALAPRYSVEGLIGRGGMATVYRAHDTKNDRPVAVKVLRPELAAVLGRERFLNEIRVTANLNNPHILPLYDSGEAGDHLYYVMPFVEGESLRDRLRRERQLTVTDAVALTGQVCLALAHAHQHGVIHRDIKPENVLLEDGEAVVADFGLALAVQSAGLETVDGGDGAMTEGYRITSRGIAVGTPEYMSPEQASGDAFVDHRSDIYALGCVFYEMLAGDPPFGGSNPSSVLARQVTEQPHAIATVRPDVPADLERIVMRCLAKAPPDRFQSATELAGALGDADLEARGSWAPKRAHPMRWIGTAAAVVGLAGAAWLVRPTTTLDANRIVVFPPEVTVTPGVEYEPSVGLGPTISLVTTAALDGFGKLRWVDGADLLGGAGSSGSMPSRVPLQRLARGAGAAYYIDGRVVIDADSARMLWALRTSVSGRVVARADTAGLWEETTVDLGLRAAGRLLVSLLPTDQSVPATSVAGRPPEAIQQFVQGERRFRRGEYEDAYIAFDSAVGQDSAFALAAYKASLAALWRDSLDLAERFVKLALDNRETLVRRDAHLADAMQAFLHGDAEAALAGYRGALDLDPAYVPAMLGIGQVHRHLLPLEARPDSAASDAFRGIYEFTGGAYRPAVGYLAQAAVREGEYAEARRYIAEMRELTPEDPALAAAELMLACVQYGPEAIDWEAEAIRDLEAVYDAGRSLHIGATHPSCERAVWRAIIEHDVPNSFRKFSAVIGLMSLQIAMDDVDGLRGLIDWVSASAPHWADNIRDFLMLADLAGLSVGGDAAERAEDIRRSLPGLLEGQWDTELWFLGVWSAYRGNVDQARELRDTLGAWAKDGHRRTVLLATSLDAHVAIVDGDTARAVALLDGLRPNGPRPDLTWYPWEGLGLEWLTLAKIELARGNHAKAFDVASWLDAPGSVPNLMYMRESLAVRADAARQLERNDRVALLERRMDRLRGR